MSWTKDERDRISDLERRLEKMDTNISSDSERIASLYDYLMKPPVEGRPSRAQQLDDLLVGVRTGKLTIRAFMWFAGAVAAIGAAAEYIRRGW